MDAIHRFRLIVLAMAVALVPATMASASQHPVAQVPPILTPSPTSPPDLVVSSVAPVGQPSPCEGDYDQLENLSPADFLNLQAYQRARAVLVQQLRACETQAGYPVFTLPPPPPPACSAGQATTFTIEVRNIGTGYTPHRAGVLLSIDGVGTATTTTSIDDFGPGAQTSAVISAVLTSGTHAFTVTVNPDHEFVESDFSNNTFSNANLNCV